MKHQATFADEPLANKFSDAMEVGNPRLTLRSFLGALSVGLALSFSTNTLRAEEQQPSDSLNPEQPVSSSYFLELSQVSSIFLGHGPETSGFKIREIFHLIDMGREESVLNQEIARQDQDDDDRSVTLFRKVRASRYAYQAWADVDA